MADGWDAWGAEGVSPVQRELEQIAAASSASSISTTPQPAAANGPVVAETSTGWTANTPYTSLPPQQPPQRRSPIQSPTSAAPPSRQYPPQLPNSPAPSASAFTPLFTSRGKGEISIAGRASGSSQAGSIQRSPSANGSQRGTMDFSGYRGSSVNGPSNAQAPTTFSTTNNGWSSSLSTRQEARTDVSPPSSSSHYPAQNGHSSRLEYPEKHTSSKEGASSLQNGQSQRNGGGGCWERESISRQSKPVEQSSGWGAAPDSSTSAPIQSNPAGMDNGWGAPISKPANNFENTPSYSNNDNGELASGNGGGWRSSAPSNGGNNYPNGDGGYGAQSSSYGGYGNGGGGGSRACFNCGEAGHNSRDCTNPRTERKPEVTLDPPAFLKGAIIGAGCCHLKDLSAETGAYVSLHKPDPMGNPDYKVIAIFKKHNEGMEIVEHALKVLVGRIKEREGGWMPEGKALDLWMKSQGSAGNTMSSLGGQDRQGSYGHSQVEYRDTAPRNSYGNPPYPSQWGGAPSQTPQPPQNTSGGWGAPNTTQSQPIVLHHRRSSAADSEAGFTYPTSNHGGSAIGRIGSSQPEPALAQMAQASAQQEKGFETAQAAHAPPPVSHGREKTSDSGFASSYAAPDSNGWYGLSSSTNNDNGQSISPSREMNASAPSFNPKANMNGSSSHQHNSGPSNGLEAAAPSSAPMNGRDRAPSVVSHRSNGGEREVPPQERRRDVGIQQPMRNTGGGGWEVNDNPAPQAQQNGWGGCPSPSQHQTSPSNGRDHNGYASPPMSTVRQSTHSIRSSAGSEKGGEPPSAAPVASGWNAGPSAAPAPAFTSNYDRRNEVDRMSSRLASSSISDDRRREEGPPPQAVAAPRASGWDMPDSYSSITIAKAPASGWEEGPSSNQAATPTISRYENGPSHTLSMQRAPPAQDHHPQSNGWSNGGGNHEPPRSSQTMNGSSGSGWEGNTSSPSDRDQPIGNTNRYSSSPSAPNGENANGYARSSYGGDNASAAPPQSEVGSVRSGNGSINPGWAASSRGPLPPQNAAFGRNANGPPMNGYSGAASYGGGGSHSYGGNRGFSSGGGGGGGYGGFGGSQRSGGNEIPLRNNRWGRPPSSSVSSNNAPPASNIPSLPGSGW